MADPISRRRVIVGGLTFAGAVPLRTPTAFAASTAASADVGSLVTPEELPWPAARTIVATTAVPRFRNATYNVLSYGAVADANTDNTAAFQRAITACYNAGGGTVVIPSGTYVTGAIAIRSNVNLRLDGATLRFTADASKYPVVLTRYAGIECMNRSPMIYAHGAHSIALTGRGTLDALATSSWNRGSELAWLETLVAQGVPPNERVVPGSGHSLRSSFIEPYGCDTVLIQGITLRNPMFWQIHPTLCKNVTIDGVTTDGNTARTNTDAVDPESCDHVVIRNCNLGANDDNVAIKSGRDADGRRVNVPCQNIVVFGCRMNGNSGAINCGSEQTGGIRNVYAYKCTLIGATAFALYIKSNTRRGGFSDNINVDSFSGTIAGHFVFVTSTYKDQTGSFLPRFSRITVTNSSSSRIGRSAWNVNGLSSSHIQGLTLRNCTFAGVVDTNNTANFIDNLSITNVWTNGRRLPDVNPIRTDLHEAEHATIWQGTVDSEYPGFSGTGFVNYANAIGSYVQWIINVAAAGKATLALRYANGTTTSRPMDISVNGTVVASGLSFPGTGAWSMWQVRTLTAALSAGANVIRATATTTNGGPNVDYLELRQS